MNITDKARLLQDRQLCDHCFGRQFARLGYGLENYERAWIIYDKLESGEDIDEDDFDRDNIPDRDKQIDEGCSICSGLFRDLDTFVDRVFNSLERYDFTTYLVGTRPPSEVVQAEEKLWEEAGLQWVEPIKSELNRLIGKGLEARLEDERGMDVDVGFERPDVNPVLDLEKDRVELQVNSLLIHGFYNKLQRGIPQTKWPCGNCRGKGCDECDWTGKQYQESVEELVAAPVIEATSGLESKFHGAGREDVDAKCLGKREFVLEITEPQQRDLDLDQLQQQINEEHSGKVEVFNLAFCSKDMVERVKSRRSNKTYRAHVKLAEGVAESDLEKLQQLQGTVKQKTPTRVEHRRAAKIRKRDVIDISWETVGDREIEIEITGEAGLYIKELISGDKSKTKPSVSQVLGVDAECEDLDVIAIEKPEGYSHLRSR
jgi:tRNA pseudouridine synthase 10